ncbi:MAG: HNH endonuclease [Paraclostridium sp.]
MTNNDIKPEKRPKMIGKDIENDKWERDEQKSKQCLKDAKYKCEIDSTHTSFTSKSTKHNYVEAHHLIPLNHQEKFENSLNVLGNLVSLCPNCHKKIHLATEEERIELIKQLYKNRKDLLQQYGIEITLEELIKLY